MLQLRFPKGLIAVEKEIQSLNRRFDVLAFANVQKELTPLLLVECKAHDWNKQEEMQLLGYNFWFKAPFFAMQAPNRIQMFWKEMDKIKSVNFLPKYQDLLNASRQRF